MMESKPPLSWMQTIKNSFPEAFEIPLFGKAPPFNWESFSSLLADRFESNLCSIRSLKQEWLSAEEVQKEAPAQSTLFSILCNPLNSLCYFVLAKADRNKLTSWMMQSKTKGQISEAMKEGFCRFLALEALAASHKIEPLSKLTLSLGEEAHLPDESAFCVEVECSLNETSCFGKLILPTSFRKAWVAHFANFPLDYTPPNIAQAIELVVGLEYGSLFLSQAEWKSVKKGDFLLLDQSGMSAKEKTGLALLKLGTTPLFQIKVTQNQLELLDYATQEESMEQEPSENPINPVEEENASIKNIPMQVCVELARFKISLDRLIRLQPGNTLELPVHPDQGVTLTINGKKVGKAELLNLGESLGIRILEIGK